MLVGRPFLLQRLPLGPAEHTQQAGAEGGGRGAEKSLLPPHPSRLVWTAQVKKCLNNRDRSFFLWKWFIPPSECSVRSRVLFALN